MLNTLVLKKKLYVLVFIILAQNALNAQKAVLNNTLEISKNIMRFEYHFTGTFSSKYYIVQAYLKNPYSNDTREALDEAIAGANSLVPVKGTPYIKRYITWDFTKEDFDRGILKEGGYKLIIELLPVTTRKSERRINRYDAKLNRLAKRRRRRLSKGKKISIIDKKILKYDEKKKQEIIRFLSN